MNGFMMVDGVAEISDPGLYETWIDDDEFKAAVAEAETSERTAIKRLLVEFEADLARIVRDGTAAEQIADIVTKYIDEEYLQHDPNVPGGGREGLIEHFKRMPSGGPTPPPVVGVLLDGTVACVMMRALVPDPTAPGATYEWNILTAFRVLDGKIAEHWSAFQKMVPGHNPMEMG